MPNSSIIDTKMKNGRVGQRASHRLNPSCLTLLPYVAECFDILDDLVAFGFHWHVTGIRWRHQWKIRFGYHPGTV